MGYKLVYVFHPCRGETENEISGRVQEILSKFLHENEDEAFWHDCFQIWHGLFKTSGKTDFAAYLSEDGFVEVTNQLFEKAISDSEFPLSLNDCDVAGFFIRNTTTGEPESIWQLLNENGRIDAFFTDANELTKPLLTKSGRNVQSCFVSHLDRENSPVPDAYVYCGQWVEEDWLDPVTGEWQSRSKEKEWNEPWPECFWAEVEKFSPNTRVTAVDCHY